MLINGKIMKNKTSERRLKNVSLNDSVSYITKLYKTELRLDKEIVRHQFS